MEIRSIGSFQLENTSSLHNQTQQSKSVFEAQESFKNSLKNAIEHVSKVQYESDQKTTALANGQINDLHDVMITAKKSSITLQIAVEMQKKAIDAYNEVMRMQV